MDEYIYSAINRKNKRSNVLINELDEHVSLREVLSQDWALISEEHVIKAFCNDLKSVLAQNEIGQMIEALMAVEVSLEAVDRDRIMITKKDLPSLHDFHANLSPLLLRALWENSKGSGDISYVMKGWMEALRIAVEEEFYIWQEKLI